MFSYILAHTSITTIIANTYFITYPLDNNRTNATIVAKTDTDNINKAVAEATTLRDSISIVEYQTCCLTKNFNFCFYY